MHTELAGVPIARRAGTSGTAENLRVADRLREASELLKVQGASRHRVAAYRAAAAGVKHYPRGAREILDAEGVRGLDEIPDVGLGIASAIAEMLVTGKWSQLERLRGTTRPEKLFQTVPGIGPALAARIHDELHVESLEGLEAAAHDGRLDAIAGIGERRIAALRASIDSVLGRIRGGARPGPADVLHEPPVSMILEVDREYREAARAGKLRRIAPRRFNPSHEAWLPVLHTQRGAWHFTVLYSNTALAHKLGRTDDWVVIYFYDADHIERQRTVVTEPHRPLAGQRVVRGREAECQVHYSRY
jgi:hypothetical protein